ncbi:uncharacterized protein LOC126978900 [Leptidea sinapis]|uniref:uncharacterized protein LOC126978900 n=1 Tax=Leptidea sinapis TaxID=189913 RepID=UPI002123BD0D|nr:uncharacterized protein LOC126978900 [Leptidea sinapis]
MKVIMLRSKIKILEEIHPLDVIQEVEKWPVLYVKDCPERMNHHFKNKIWNEIGKALLPEWEQYSDSEKNVKVTDLMKKWRNLRDTFRRHVEIEKQRINGNETVKRKRYVYFKHMMFLLPHIAQDTESDNSLQPKLNEYLHNTPAKKKRKDMNRRLRKEKVPLVVEKRAINESIDEDKHFLMSLIPSFKKMSDDEKLTAKVEILKVIQQVRSSAIEVVTETVDCGSASGNNVKIELISEDIDLESDSQEGSEESD